MRRYPALFIVALCSIILVACGDDGRSGDGGDGDWDDWESIAGDYAGGINITGVEIYQGTRIALMEEGVDADPTTDVVQGRDAVVRIYVERTGEWLNREVVARVDFISGSNPHPIEVAVTPDTNSVVTDSNSTLNVRIPGENIEQDTKINVSVRELASGSGGSGDRDGSVWPEEDEFEHLHAVDTEGSLNLVIVPVRYNADGSGRLPDTSQAQLDLIKDEFYGMYPIEEIELTVLDPFDWSQQVVANGGGWVNLLNAITDLRNNSGAADDEYYYGLFSPSNSFGAFCGMGCVSGLSNLVTDPGMAWGRASIGLGFAGNESTGTMAHEVGHAHGRMHAPSGGAADIDPNYPYAGGFIGEWGMSLINDGIMGPQEYYDFMGYAPDHIWISDYNYKALLERIVAVNTYGQADMVLLPEEERAWKSINLAVDGTATPGPSITVKQIPYDAPTMEVELYDEANQLVEIVTGYVHYYDHVEDELIIFPTDGDDSAATASLVEFPSLVAL